MSTTSPTRSPGPRSPLTALAVFCALGLAPIACSSSPPPAEAVSPRAGADAGVRAGDVIRLAVWREEDVTGEFSVDDRGIVTLPLLGERQVAGTEPAVLRGELLEAYREYYRTPSIEVTVLRRVNILGAVNVPGLYPVDATISLSEALGLAGGISPTGDRDDVRVIRDGQIIERDLDWATTVSAADIRSGDQVVVGEQSWLERNPGALIGSLIAAAAGVTIALIR